MTADRLSRRDFLSSALFAVSFYRVAPFSQAIGSRVDSTSRFISAVPLGNPGGAPATPFGRLLGSGLDARLFTDLSQLGITARTSSPSPRTSPAAPLTSTEEFFVRTAAPPAAGGSQWRVALAALAGGGDAPAVNLTMSDLDRMAAPGGRYLVECSGNVDQANYGLMSTADWDGVPLTIVLDRIGAPRRPYRVLITGLDDHPTASRTSTAGASWIFTPDQLQRAILATRMNGSPLTPNHGAPVRLLVPGWYGCASIKWVNRIEFVEDDAPATSQMLEFAARTHQDPGARLARDFTPAVIDTAAMPVRVEKWIVDGRVAYRLTGIIWGGNKPTNRLSIRFRSDLPWRPVDDCPLPSSMLTWNLWSHTWRPDSAGRYQIVLRVDDPSIRTRRLDLFFYVREIEIDEI
jgi:DMSO/TMAO reductase YedYZ molybdopterin-dependent catalytic subunit